MVKLFAFASLTIAILLSGLSAQAQTPQTVDGTTSVIAVGNAGDTTTGGFTAFSGTGTYNAGDLLDAKGNAEAAGSGTTTPTPSTATTPAKAVSTAVLSTAAVANSTGPTSITLAGVAQQGQWASKIDDTTTFAASGNNTLGKFSGDESGTTPLSGTGKANADGNSFANTTGAGTNNVATEVKTTGSSSGTTSFASTKLPVTTNVSSAVSGTGSAGAGSLAGQLTGPVYSEAGLSGHATYSATNPTGANATGNLNIEGKTSSIITLATPTDPTVSIAASSTVQSMATAH